VCVCVCGKEDSVRDSGGRSSIRNETGKGKVASPRELGKFV